MSGIYHLKDAADRLGVSVEVVREWIDRGLRAFALGHSTDYRPRDYLIREEWLLAFLDAQAAVRPRGKTEDTIPVEVERPKRTRRGVVSRGHASNPLGPCPK